MTIEGVLRVDKPEGPTSHDAVQVVRRALRIRRVGHTGTLDPFATGLLLICVGRATRLAEFLSGLPKTYVAEALLGTVTDTLDRAGAVVSTTDEWRSLSEEAVTAALMSLEGEQDQLPPVYSAKRVGGERAHRLARRGEAVEVKPARVTVREIEVLELDLPRVRFRARVSSGTYVRALARDLGEALGVGAHLRALRREAVGPHSVDGAVMLDSFSAPVDQTHPEKVPATAWLTPLQALAHLPRVDLTPAEREEIGHGRAIHHPDYDPASVVDPARATADDGTAVADDGMAVANASTPVVLAAGDELIAIARRAGDQLRPRKVFA